MCIIQIMPALSQVEEDAITVMENPEQGVKEDTFHRGFNLIRLTQVNFQVP